MSGCQTARGEGEWFNARKDEVSAKTAAIKVEIAEKEAEMAAAAKSATPSRNDRELCPRRSPCLSMGGILRR